MMVTTSSGAYKKPRRRPPTTCSSVLMLLVVLILLLFKLNILLAQRNSIHHDSNYNTRRNLIHSKSLISAAENENNVIMQQPCQPVYFWSSAKGGSTILHSLLLHTGHFVTTPAKEIGWALGENNNPVPWRVQMWSQANQACDDDRRFVLDGYPSYIRKDYAKKLYNDNPNAKFVMLVRNPIDRAISRYNQMTRHDDTGEILSIDMALLECIKGREQDDGTTSSKLTKRQYINLCEENLYGVNLQNLLSVGVPRESVLVVNFEAFQHNADEIVRQVMNHIGVQHYDKSQVDYEAWGSTKKYNISNQTRKQLQKYYQKDRTLLQNQIGKRFPWSWIEEQEEKHKGVISGNNWVSVIPHGK